MTSGAWYTITGRKLRTCKRCGGHDLAWAQSKRTGRYYLAETRQAVSESEAGSSMKDNTFWVMPNRPHKCDPQRQAQERQTFAEQWDARRAEADAFNAEWASMKNEFAAREAEQERAAIEAKMARDEALMQQAPRPTRPAKPRQQAQEPPEGIHYVKAENAVYKVQVAVHGSGQRYAKHLIPVLGADGKATGDGTWEYVGRRGPFWKLSAATLMTVEDAQAFGKLYGMCAVCGRTLTLEQSIERGIGPVCWKRLTANERERAKQHAHEEDSLVGESL